MGKTSVDLFLQPVAWEQVTLYQAIRHVKQQEQPITAQVAQQRAGGLAIEDINLRYVAALMGRKYGTVYNTYQRLLATLAQLAPAEAALPTLMAVAPDDLRLALVKQSVPYALLTHLLAEDLPDFDSLLAAVQVSKVTALRYLRPLRDLARQLGVRIVYETLRLSGPEPKIRAFLTLAFWLATNGAGWPFTMVGEAQAQARANRQLAAFGMPLGNPVAAKLFAYLTTVSQQRQRHQHLNVPPREVLAAKVPNVLQGEAPLTASQQRVESAHLLLLLMTVPLAAGPADPAIAVAQNAFARYRPDLLQVVTRVQASLQAVRPLPAALGPLVQVTLATVAASVLSVGYDVGSLVADRFNPNVGGQSDARLRDQIQRALLAAFDGAPLAANSVLAKQVDEALAPLTAAFYQNLLQLDCFTVQRPQVKVALALEPAGVGFVDLLVFLNQQPMVTLVYDHFAQADLIIADAGLPLPASSAAPLQFRWNIAASNDRFGELFSLLYTIQQEKAAQ